MLLKEFIDFAKTKIATAQNCTVDQVQGDGIDGESPVLGDWNSPSEFYQGSFTFRAPNKSDPTIFDVINFAFTNKKVIPVAMKNGSYCPAALQFYEPAMIYKQTADIVKPPVVQPAPESPKPLFESMEDAIRLRPDLVEIFYGILDKQGYRVIPSAPDEKRVWIGDNKPVGKFRLFQFIPPPDKNGVLRYREFDGIVQAEIDDKGTLVGSSIAEDVSVAGTVSGDVQSVG